MAPLPPAMLKLEDAVKMTAVALEISQGLALDRLLDGLCDGAIFAIAVFPSTNGAPNCLTISPANWQMHKYNGADLHYDFVEVATADLIKWLKLDDRGEIVEQVAEAARSGAPGRPSSMHLVLDEARRRVAEGSVLSPTKKAFANELAEWVTAQPGEARLTGKTIANNAEITALFSSAKRARNPSPK